MANLQQLPAALLVNIVSYMGDPQTICYFEATSKTFLGVVEEAGQWDTLHRQRWTTSNNEITEHDNRRRYSKADYRRRFLIDKKTIRCIEILQTETTEREDVVKNVAEVMSFGRDCMDICWKFWNTYYEDENDGGGMGEPDPSRAELVAMCLLRSVHCSVVFEDILRLCHHEGDGSAQGSDNTVEEDPGELLEEHCIVSSRIFFNLRNGPRDTTSEWIRQQLDDIANQVKERFSRDNNDDLGAVQKLEHLNAVFFDELNFSGNTENYYDFQNSLLHVALQRRTGIPMTLAVLYKCVARRVGLQVEIIGLPGHIVIGLPELNNYVDVFRKGRRLMTVADLELIVNSYGHRMIPEYLQPLTPAQVFRRILNNFGACLLQTFPPETTKRMAVEAMRAVLINPSNDQVEDCRRWFSQILWGSQSDAILREMWSW